MKKVCGAALAIKLLSVFLICALSIALSACGETTTPEDGTEGDGGDGGGLTEVTLILDYLPNTNHTGFYVARSKGYYEEAGLDVDIIEPADNAVTALIATGRGDYGVSYQEDVTYALTADEPLPIKAIATVIQHNTSGFAAYKDKNITRPKDFEGKVYAGWGAPSEEAVIKAVMEADGGDFSKLTIVTSDGSGYAALKDKVDLNWIFWAWDGIAAERDGVPLNYLELSQFDERLDYYTPVIIASNEKLANDPDTTRAFLAATKRGYEYAIENPEESAEILSEHVEGYDTEMLTESQKYLNGKYIDDAERWGEMKDEVWDRYSAFMREYGLITADIPASECYTNEFLE
ncbi:MAG: ABC transporter substrate-binding protein [Clostridiales Family XIII bacterium]|nr:ABC transporter substrate-binding protein [Clostridiales Family XIII bacterium]